MDEFKQNNMYRVVYLLPGDRKPRVIVAQYLETVEDGNVIMSGRPAFGDAKLFFDTILHIEELPKDAEPEVPKIWRGEIPPPEMQRKT